MTKEELAAECYQIVGALYDELIEAREAAGGYVSALAKENVTRILDGLSAIEEGEDIPSLLPFDVNGD